MANTEVLKEPRGFIRILEIVSKQCDKLCTLTLPVVVKYQYTNIDILHFFI